VPNPSGPSPYIASSSNDGMIRFFTQDPAAMAPQAERENWEKEVRERQLDKCVYGGLFGRALSVRLERPTDLAPEARWATSNTPISPVWKRSAAKGRTRDRS
jgi:hypothetical protein